MRKSLVLVMLFFGLWMGVSAHTPEPEIELTQPRTPDGQALYELFSGEDCALDCFMGIKPNVTTEQEFTDWLDAQQLAYESPTHAPEEIYWSIPPSTFIPYNRLSAFVLDGSIREISGPIDAPVEVILEVFGAPASMTFDLSATQNAAQALVTYMVYPEYGLGFKLHKASFPDVHTTSFVLTFPDDPYGWAAYPLGTPMTDTCSNYEVWPCFAPTATPTPTPSTLSDADQLRALFGDDCLTACFMGIEPGVTTLQEVEFRLQQENITYSKNVYDENATIEWELSHQEFVTDGEASPFIFISFSSGLVLKVIAPLNAPIAAVIEVFGNPTYVTEERGRYTLTYPQYGLTFVVERSVSAEKTFVVYIDTLTNPNAEFAVLGGEPVTQTCEIYGVPPCIVPTATPTPIP